MGWKSEEDEQALGLFVGRLERNAPGADDSISWAPNTALARLQEFWNRGKISHLSGSSTPEQTFTESPKQVGEYQIEKMLGQGGFGTVYLARKEKSAFLVALKWLHRDRPESRERFLREAALATSLKHPGIVQSLECGEHQGRPYFTMEYIRGESLSKKLETMRYLGLNSGSAQDPSLFIAWMIQLAETLSFLHRNGIIHRDFKPGNVMIDLQGQPRLSDLGLAFQWDDEEQASYLGTLPYMSPEQVRGEEPSPQSDLFSFGVSFYELLTLRRPFSGSNREELRRAILEFDPVPPRKLNPAIPKPIEAILLNCLRKSRERRYWTAEELVQDLQRYLKGEPVRAQGWIRSRLESPSFRRTAKRSLFGLGAASLLLCSSLAAFSKPSPPKQPMTALSRENSNVMSVAGNPNPIAINVELAEIRHQQEPDESSQTPNSAAWEQGNSNLEEKGAADGDAANRPARKAPDQGRVDRDRRTHLVGFEDPLPSKTR